jgi:hypothetical protein
VECSYVAGHRILVIWGTFFHPPEAETEADAKAERRRARIAALTDAARRKSAAKVRAAEKAIARLVKQGEPVTFQRVQREARVSHSFLYGHPQLRRRIEQLRQRQVPERAERASTGRNGQPDGNVVTVLTAQLARLKQAHREEVAALRRALEAAHGENLALRREMTRRGWEPPGARRKFWLKKIKINFLKVEG